MPNPIDIGRRILPEVLPGALSGAMFGGGLGGFSGLFDPAETAGDRVRNVGRGALSGGLTGGAFGGILGAAGGIDQVRTPRSSPQPAVDPTGVPWLKDIATKADAKNAFRTQARATHPDLGEAAQRVSREEAMKGLNVTWDGVQRHPTFQKWSFDQGAEAAYTRFGVSWGRQKRAGDDDVAAAAVATAAGASPFLGMIGQQPLVHDPYLNKDIPRMSFREVAEAARPGDSILTSTDGLSPWKTPQSVSTGSGMYHVEPVVGQRDGLGLVIKPGEELQGAAGTNEEIRAQLRDIETRMNQGKAKNVLLMRPKDINSAQASAIAEDALTRARGPYHDARAVKAYLKDIFVPKMERRAKGAIPEVTPGEASHHGTVCSTPSSCAYEKVTGNKVVPGQPTIDALPSSYLRSRNFVPIGASLSEGYRASRMSPYLFRGLLGAGLAAGTYGAVRGLRKLKDK